MPCLQPEIMIVYGLHQNGGNACAVGAKGVGVDLVAYQSRFRCWDAVLGKTLIDALGKGLLGVSDHCHVPLPAEFGDPVVVAVGDDAQLNVGKRIHICKPGFHLLRGGGSGIGYDGIVKIQHQQADIPLPEQFRSDVRKLIRDEFGQWRKGHIVLPEFIRYGVIIA